MEAAIFLPLVLLTVLSLGYFMKVEGTWENCVHGALDESRRIASRAYDKSSLAGTADQVERRILMDNPQLERGTVTRVLMDYSDGTADHLVSYQLNADMHLAMPAGFERDFSLRTKIKFRGFVGKKTAGAGLGNGLEREESEHAVWIFPQSGEKYHGENCTYVKASVSRRILSSSLRRRYDACALCGSQELSAGSVVFCFSGENTAYHKGTCRSIKRRTIVIDQSEAEARGYRPCSKCGGVSR